MAQRWAALIRGINVGTARRIAMADLRAWVAGLGFDDVSTLLNSGNVVFSRPGSSTRPPAQDLERVIARHAGFSAAVVALSAPDIETLIRENPLASASRNPSRLQVAAVRTPADLRRLSSLATDRWGSEILACGTVAAYLWCPDGVAKSRLVQAVGALLGDAVTMRNWATMLKLQGMVDGVSNAQGRRKTEKAQSRVAAARHRS